MEDKKFIDDLNANCPIAWRLFNEMYFERIGNRVLIMVPDTFYTNELRQKVLIRIMNALPKFNGDSKLWTWIYRIIANVCNTHLAEVAKKLLTTISIDKYEGGNMDYHEAHGDGGGDNQEEQVHDNEANRLHGHSDPSKNMENEESQTKVDKIISILKGNQWEVFNYVHNKGYSNAEIAKILGVSVEAVEKLYKRAVAKLAKFLSPKDNT